MRTEVVIRCVVCDKIKEFKSSGMLLSNKIWVCSKLCLIANTASRKVEREAFEDLGAEIMGKGLIQEAKAPTAKMPKLGLGQTEQGVKVMDVTIKNGKLHVVIDIAEEPAATKGSLERQAKNPAKGLNLGLASTGGFVRTGAIYDGKTVRLNLNAIIEEG